MFKTIIIWCLLSLLFVGNEPVECARILGIFPIPAPSHYILGHQLMKALVERGHEVTMISVFGQKNPVNNYNDILVDGLTEKMEDLKKDLFNGTDASTMNKIWKIISITEAFASKSLEHPKVQDFIKSDKKFDLVIMETFLNEAHVGFAHRFNCPLVIFSTIGSNIMVDHYTHNPCPTSYCSHMLLHVVGKMSFMDRLKNFGITAVMSALIFASHMPRQNTLMHQYFPDAPELEEVIKQRTSIVLLNSHTSIGSAKPLVPNMIEIGGFHIAEQKQLPQDLQNYLDSAKQGFILFSLGSHVKSIMLPEEKRNAIMEVFKDLPYKVLWKFENDQLPGKPANVKIDKWLPQNDILAHPNLKLFITHGGLLSTTEAVYHGVPIVGIPILGDQRMNMAVAEKLGIGKTVQFTELSYETLSETLNEVLNNKMYRENVRERSRLFRDRPMKPIDTAVYWVEYALRNKYANHLKTSALDLTWYEESMLDVYAVLGAIIFAALFAIYWVLKKLFCKSNTLRQEKKKN